MQWTSVRRLRQLALDLLVLGSLAKLLLFPAYHSTDFDVHRNWLAITASVPFREWYFEATSPWTLDYPPFFAYFEWALGRLVPAAVRRDGCLRIVGADGQYGWPTVVFQRTSVLATELVFAAGMTLLDAPTAALLWLCPAWLLLDHIHFQYNASMFGLFVFSLCAMQRRQYLWSAFLFATLLCFKHIYLYVAPAYAAFLLRNYVLRGMRELAQAATVTLLPFMAAFAPLAALGVPTLRQVLARLFPFSRGLTHAYWAPNAWALYSFADRVLGAVRGNSVAAATRGVVGQVAFANLPAVAPRTTFVITLAFQLLTVLGVGESNFVECVTLCGFASFLFGWHVHEKAVMTVLVPFALCARRSNLHLNAFVLLLVPACFSLFPLIWTPGETVLKAAYTVAYLLGTLVLLPRTVPGGRLSLLVVLYTLGFALVMPASALVPLALPKYEYAGLMLVSVYSTLGVVASWLALLYSYILRRGGLSTQTEPKTVAGSDLSRPHLVDGGN